VNKDSSNKQRSTDALKAGIISVCSIDINPYNSEEPHLRLPTTVKEGVTGSALLPMCIIQNGDCKTVPDEGKHEELNTWLSAVSEVCTINYITSSVNGDADLLTIEDPSSLPVEYLEFCAHTLVQAQNIIREPVYMRALASMDSEVIAKHGMMISSISSQLSHIEHIMSTKLEAETWQSMVSFPRWRTDEDCFTSGALLKTNCVDDIYTLVCNAVFMRRQTLRFFERNPSATFSGELSATESERVRNRMQDWKAADTHDIRFGYFAIHSNRSYMPVHCDDSLAFRGKVDINSTTCVWKKHKTAKVILEFVVGYDFRGDFSLQVKIGCWNASGCNRPMYVLLEADTTALAESVFNKAAVYHSTASGPSPRPMIPISEYHDHACDHDASVRGIGRLSDKIHRMRALLQQFTRCIMITCIEVDEDQRGRWVATCAGHDSKQQNVYAPIAPKWTDDEFLLFKSWAKNKGSNLQINESNPGLLYLGVGNVIKAYTYMSRPEMLSALVTETLQIDDADKINEILPLAEYNDASALVELHMLACMCRPLSTCALNLVYVHRKCFTAMDTCLGGTTSTVSSVDRVIWSTLLSKAYTSAIENRNHQLTLITSPQVPAEKADYGSSCTYSAQQRCAESSKTPSVSVCRSEYADNSNMGHNAIGFTHLLFFEKWFRDTMRYLVQNDTENADSGLSINIKCFTSTPAQTDQTQNITLVTNFFETADECPQESTIQYPLWTQSSDQVEYSASWPRVGDALFDKKKRRIRTSL
jgi:hypothetical protein